MANLSEEKETSGEKHRKAGQTAKGLLTKLVNALKKSLEVQRRKRSRGAKEILMMVVPAVALLAAAALIWVVVNNSGAYSIGEETVQYYAGMESRIPENAKIRADKNGTLEITRGKKIDTILPVPLYYKERNAVLLLEDMLYNHPSDSTILSVSRFGIMECDDNYNFTYIQGEKECQIRPGFLYNGKDMYIFLEPVELRINNYVISLPPLSFVEAIYGNYVTALNYETKESIMEPIKSDAVVYAPGGGYTISLLNDSITKQNGDKSLLFTRPEFFDPIMK